MIEGRPFFARSNVKRFFLAALALGLAGSASALEFRPSTDIRLGGGYSELGGSSGSWNFAGQALFLPILKLGDSDYIVPAVFVIEGQRERVIDEEDSVDAFFLQSLLMTFKPIWKHRFHDSGWEGGIYGLLEHDVTQDSTSEPWSEGLYDFEQYGGGVQLSKEGIASWLHAAGLDLSWAHRSYPNYHNVNAATDNKNYYINDMNITKIDLTAAFPDSFSMLYSLSFRAYPDAYQYQIDGTVDLGTPRMDEYHLLHIDWQRNLAKTWNLALEFEGIYNASNQNVFDASAVGYFQPNAYSDASLALQPTLSWMPQGDPKGNMLSLSYKPLWRHYDEREALNVDGTSAGTTQVDVENTFALFGRYVVRGPWSIYCQLSEDISNSNQAYQPVVQYTYNIFAGQAGVQFQY
jgi:hypothetical protein